MKKTAAELLARDDMVGWAYAKAREQIEHIRQLRRSQPEAWHARHITVCADLFRRFRQIARDARRVG